MSDNCDEQVCCDVNADLLRADLSAPALELAAVGFAALWRGHVLRPDELLPNEEMAIVTAEALVRRGRAEVDTDGRLIGIHGVTLRDTRHRFIADGAVHNTWCAFDSIGIPAALQLDAVAQTDCPACGTTLQVMIEGGEPSGGELMLWLPSPQGAHLMTEFCAAADLYCSIEHLRQRIDTESVPGTTADLAVAASLGRETWADVKTNK